jgi:hypothetical protein
MNMQIERYVRLQFTKGKKDGFEITVEDVPVTQSIRVPQGTEWIRVLGTGEREA